MVQSSRSKAYFSEDFKLSVLKDMYENNLSVYSTAKKYGFKASSCIFAWSKKYPVDSKLLSLSDEIITRVQSMQKKRKTFVKQHSPHYFDFWHTPPLFYITTAVPLHVTISIDPLSPTVS